MFWATVAAAAVVLWYACLTRRSVKNTWTANQAGLLKQILEEHAELAEDRKAVKNWWREDPATAITRYETELKRLQKDGSAEELSMHESRRRVSQYFLRLRALCEMEMIDPKLVAATLGDEAVQVFLLYIDPLDEIVRKVDDKAHKLAERQYFQRYLRRFFPQTAQQDPWGFRSSSGK